MKKLWLTLNYNRILSALIIALLCLILFFQLFDPLNQPLWEIDWLRGYIGLAQYYAGFFSGFLAFVVGFSLNEIMKDKYTTRSIFLITGFFALSFLLIVNSLTVPTLIFPTNTENISIGSLHLGLFLGGIFFVLAGVQWPAHWQVKIVQNRKLIIFALPFFFLTYYGIFLMLQPIFEKIILVQGVLTSVLLLWASWQSLRLFWRDYADFEYKMFVTFGLLALTEITLLASQNWLMSWGFYIPALLLALLVAITAVLELLRSSSDMPLVRYFAILGSTLIIAFSIANVEVGMVLIPVPVNRVWLIPFVLLQGVVSFLVLLFVVMRLNRLIKQRTAALKLAQYQRTELTQLIVHDLKSPLTVLLSGMSLLNNETLGELTAMQKKLLHSLEQSGQDILLMINDLLDVERMEEGKLQLVQSTFEPINLTQECVTALQIVANTHKQHLSFSHSAQRPFIRADKRLIQRVINNLITNALKFTPDDGQIHVNIESTNDQVLIFIEDSGPGIPVAEQERIFEKFAQLKGNERRGAGLGLTFCKMVTEAHNGQLTVGNSQFNGALFKLALPLWEEPPYEDVTYSSLSDLSLAK